MNRSGLVTILAIGTITGILIASLLHILIQLTRALSNSDRCVPINTFLRILRNMISVLEETELRILIDQNDRQPEAPDHINQNKLRIIR